MAYRDSNGMGIMGVIVGVAVAIVLGYLLLGPSTTSNPTTARVETPKPPVTAPVPPSPAPATKP
jgi:hypothetical protein